MLEVGTGSSIGLHEHVEAGEIHLDRVAQKNLKLLLRGCPLDTLGDLGWQQLAGSKWEGVSSRLTRHARIQLDLEFMSARGFCPGLKQELRLGSEQTHQQRISALSAICGP